MEYAVNRVEKPDWESVPAVTLQHTPWLTPNAVTAKAQLCHNGQTLFLRMQAQESEIRATLTEPLSQISNDSCLEFFFAPDKNDSRYFNFECNPLGTLNLGFGAARPTRVRQIVKSLDMFRISPFFIEGGWGFTMEIPLSFIQLYFPTASFAGFAACNFYKCGDQTASPHYLSWNPMPKDKMDFHRRQDFGCLRFL